MAEAKGILEYLGIPWVETEEETDYQAEARAAVDWLTENGIMQGNAEGDLMLDQPLTRRQSPYWSTGSPSWKDLSEHRPRMNMRGLYFLWVNRRNSTLFGNFFPKVNFYSC